MNNRARIPLHLTEKPFLACLHRSDTELCSPGCSGPQPTAFPFIFPPEPYLDMVMRQAEDLLGHQQSLCVHDEVQQVQEGQEACPPEVSGWVCSWGRKQGVTVSEKAVLIS